MIRRLNAKQTDEVLFIRKWCLTIIDFLYSANPVDAHLIELRKEAFSEETQTKYLEQVSCEIYLKGLRQAHRDINKTAKNAPKQILDELNKKLSEQFGKDLSSYSLNSSTQILKILKRGMIINDNEFILAEERVSELCEIDLKSPELNDLNKLLSAYQLLKKQSL